MSSNKPSPSSTGAAADPRSRTTGRAQRREYEKRSKQRAEERMSVRGVRRDNPDPKRLAQVLIRLALQEAEAERMHLEEAAEPKAIDNSGAGDAK